MATNWLNPLHPSSGPSPIMQGTAPCCNYIITPTSTFGIQTNNGFRGAPGLMPSNMEEACPTCGLRTLSSANLDEQGGSWETFVYEWTECLCVAKNMWKKGKNLRPILSPRRVSRQNDSLVSGVRWIPFGLCVKKCENMMWLVYQK